MEATVVVGVDTSAASRDAVRLGARLADAEHGRLRLVLAAYDATLDAAAIRLGLDVEPLRAESHARARRQIRQTLAETVGKDLLEESLLLRSGRPELVLEEVAHELAASWIVLGGKRREGIGAWFRRRGTAHHLLRELDVPLLVTGTGASAPTRVLTAVDLSTAAHPTIRTAERLSLLLGVPLALLHVVDDQLFRTEMKALVELEALVAACERRLEEEIWPFPARARERSVRIGPVVDTILATAAEASGTIVAVGAQGTGRVRRRLVGSTTEELLERLPSTLLVVPCPAPETPGTAPGANDAP